MSFKWLFPLLLLIIAQGHLTSCSDKGAKVSQTGPSLLNLPGDSSWKVKGNFLLDSSIDPKKLKVVIYPAAETFAEATFKRFNPLDKKGRFHLTKVSTGEMTVALMEKSNNNTLFTQTVNLGPKAGIFKTQDIDLSNRFHALTFKVMDKKGELIPFSQVQEKGKDTNLATSGYDPLDLITSKNPIDLVFMASGYPSFTLLGATKSQDVILPNGLRVKLKIDNAPNLPPGWAFQIYAWPPEDAGDGLLSTMFFLGSTMRGITTLPVAGTYTLHLAIVDLVTAGQPGSAGTAPTVIVERQGVEHSFVVQPDAKPQIVHVTIDQEALDNAMEEVWELFAN